MDLDLDNVYVVHAPMGYEKQGEYSSKLLAKHKIAFQFINESSLPNLTDCINTFFCATTQRQLTKGALLCTFSHILCYQKIVKNNDKFALILEDDPYLLNGFDNLLPKIISQLADLEPGFIVSLENSTLTFPSFKDIKKQQ